MTSSHSHLSRASLRTAVRCRAWKSTSHREVVRTTSSLEGLLRAVLLLAMSAGLAACWAADAVNVVIHPREAMPGVKPFSRRLIGFNVPAGHTRPQVETSGVFGPDTNGIWEPLHQLDPGLVRVWTSALDFGLDTMQLPPFDPEAGISWQAWLEETLADDSPHWEPFDRAMSAVAALGDDTAIMLCLPAFPPWIGPFRAPSIDADMSELIDLRTGQRVPYAELVTWTGMDKRMIADADAFRRFTPRVEAFVGRLLSHCLNHDTIGPALRYVSLGNEPDNPDKTGRYVCWRLWVYGPDHSARMTSGEPLGLTDQGALQQVYLAVHRGMAAVPGADTVLLGGVETAWAHTQMVSKGAFYYLDYFVHGSRPFHPDTPDPVQGVTPERIDFLTYHSYSVRPEERFRHDVLVSQLFEAYDRPLFLTEYNATAAGHGMNMMQGGAAAVADAMITLGRHPHAAGAAFFKAAGGGFGLVLRRSSGELWYTGAYWTMALFSRWFVDGQPVRVEVAADWDVDCLAVRHGEGSWAAVLLNRTEEPVAVRIAVAPRGPDNVETRTVALPLARTRSDYRHVPASDIVPGRLSLQEPALMMLAPKAVVFLRP